jgi:hypothetical protein
MVEHVPGEGGSTDDGGGELLGKSGKEDGKSDGLARRGREMYVCHGSNLLPVARFRPRSCAAGFVISCH